MLADLIEAGSRVGLHMHSTKTAVLNNRIGRNTNKRQLKAGMFHVLVLQPGEMIKYRGCNICLTKGAGEVEMQDRVACEWGKVHQFIKTLKK